MYTPFFSSLHPLSRRALRIAVAVAALAMAIAVAMSTIPLDATARSVRTLATPTRLVTSRSSSVPVGVVRDPVTHALLPVTCSRPRDLAFPVAQHAAR